MSVALVVVTMVVTLSTAVLVGVLFVWAAKKDGEYDRALQKRLRIRRKTRLGR
jgi:hypothetical protein